jgi:hypothetical protein
LAAIAYYTRIKKHPLISPMIIGWAVGKPCDSARGGGLRAILLAVIIALLAVWLAAGNLLPTPPPPVATEAPSW